MMRSLLLRGATVYLSGIISGYCVFTLANAHEAPIQIDLYAQSESAKTRYSVASRLNPVVLDVRIDVAGDGTAECRCMDRRKEPRQ